MIEFILFLFNSGYKSRIVKDFNPRNNYFGVSLYNPYEEISNGINTLILDISEIRDNKKRIIMQKGGEIIYQSCYGEIPSKEKMNEFMS